MKILRVFVIALMCCVAGCSRHQTVTPSPLLDGMMSYQTFAQIKALPKLKKAKWKVIEKSEELVVETKYTHLNFTGKATFRFYHNRLWQTWFVPSNATLYNNALIKTLGNAVNSPTEAHLGNTAITFDKNRALWSDENLSQECDDWINRYA